MHVIFFGKLYIFYNRGESEISTILEILFICITYVKCETHVLGC